MTSLLYYISSYVLLVAQLRPVPKHCEVRKYYDQDLKQVTYFVDYKL